MTCTRKTGTGTGQTHEAFVDTPAGPRGPGGPTTGMTMTLVTVGITPCATVGTGGAITIAEADPGGPTMIDGVSGGSISTTVPFTRLNDTNTTVTPEQGDAT